jgi:hypothetical protein
MVKKWNLGLLVALAVVVALVGCDASGDDDEPTYTISGTAYAPAGYNNAAAHVVGLKLVAAGAGAGGAALYSTSAVIPALATMTSYSLAGIAAGAYEGWAFIDMDGDLVPDAGDWGTTDADVFTMSADVVLDVPAVAWGPI